MGRLIDQFKDLPVDQHGEGWNKLWENDEIDLWDRGRPSPSLVDLLENHPVLFSSETESKKRKKFFIPACGRGFDLALAAVKGFDALGLELSELAVSSARKNISSELENPSEAYFAPNSDRSLKEDGLGNISVAAGDFFKSDWETIFNGEAPDIVYDYTFLCAIPPESRFNWAKRMAEIVPKDGLLICLEFPLFKESSEDGPPWSVKGVYWDLLAAGKTGTNPIDGIEDSASGEGQFVRLLREKPERQLPQGRGTDMISVWKRK